MQTTTKTVIQRGALAIFLLFGTTWCGSSDIGDECDDPYAADECVDGAVCVVDRTGFGVCRLISRVGEPCSYEGTASECVAGAICGKDAGGSIECLEICRGKDDCPSGLECNGVEGTDVKGCRFK